jgi:GT2 family glycosyltransferase
VKVVFHEKMIGYPAAINAGAEVAKGEFLILLNYDTILPEQPKNHGSYRLIGRLF